MIRLLSLLFSLTLLCLINNPIQINAQYNKMTQVLATAPWQSRNEAGSFTTVSPRTYQLPNGTFITMPGQSIVLFGGGSSRNDSWISSNAAEWYLIGGVSRLAPVTASPYAPFTFQDRSRTCDCSHPLTEEAFLLSGAFTSTVWTTKNASHWRRLADGPMTVRERPSCAVDTAGVVYMLAGYTTGPTNDVWRSMDSGNTWIQSTAAAAFPARAGSDSISFYSSTLKKDIVMITNGDYNDTRWYNDVWASSDMGVSWAQITAAAAYIGRYDSEWKYNTVSGAMIIMGGDPAQGSNLDDLYASLDGGYSWGVCAASTGIGGREDHSAVFDQNGFLVVMAGGGNDRDVYRSTFSFNDINAVASNCNLQIPSCGTGLTCWPGQSCACNNVNMWRLTASAPWQSRNEAGLSKLTTAQTYLMPGGQGSVTFGPGTMVLFGGGSSKNDVWASIDMISWTLIGGTSKLTPNVASPYAAYTFVDQSRTCDTYDRRTGRAYLIAGTTTSNVWTSGNMSHWQQMPDGQFVGRERPSCAVDDASTVYMLGGYSTEAPLNDVWSSSNNGQTWTLRTAAAAFPPRGGHDSIAFLSSGLQKQIVMVTGGDFNDATWYNDVWASSDSGVSWAQLTAAAPYIGRYDSEWKYNPVNGLIVLMGGDPAQGSNLADFWVSLDGGYSWGNCGGVNGTGIGGREDHSADFDVSGYFVIMAGGGGDRDIWRSTFSFNHIPSVAAACGLTVPACGVGLYCWPGSSTNPSCCPTIIPTNPTTSSTGTVTSNTASSSSGSSGGVNPARSSTGIVVSNSDSSSSGLSGGAIAGIVIGSIVGACLLLSIIAFCLMKGRSKKSSTGENESRSNYTQQSGRDVEMSQSYA